MVCSARLMHSSAAFLRRSVHTLVRQHERYPTTAARAARQPRPKRLRMTELPHDLLEALQARAARSSLGPSSMRGAGSRGVVGAGRPFLAQLDLLRFATSSEQRFCAELDRAT